LAPQLVGGASEVVHLDFHTGLGRWGQAQLLLCEPGELGHAGWWQTHFGAEHVKEPSVEKGAYQVRGGFGRWLKAQMPNCRYRFATAEFGTYSPARVVRSLLRELFYHSHSGPHGQQADHWSRRQLSEAFVPRSHRWRSASLSRGVALIDRAMAVLRQSPAGAETNAANMSDSKEPIKETSPTPPACSQTA
jgi:hypothetical protein